MKMSKTAGLAAAAIMVAGAAIAAPLKLEPADPQPSGLKSGLSVKYAYPLDVKNLNQAERYLKKGKAGEPLSGLDYRDTGPGEKALTSTQVENVAAAISGYVKFDSPGTYTIDFLTNDGLDARIGGQTVGYFDGRQACRETEAVEVEVPLRSRCRRRDGIPLKSPIFSVSARPACICVRVWVNLTGCRTRHLVTSNARP